MDESPFLSHFSPQWSDPEDLEAILVQREELLQESVAQIRESVLTPNKHHLLFVGARGAGKTHLVTLIHYRLTQDADLADRMRFAWLNEDETATSFLRLLVHIYRSLSERYPNEFPAATLTALAGKTPALAQEQLGTALLQGLNGRTLVCLMENLDSLFRHLDESELRTWRAFIQNHPVFATVGTAQALFDGIADRDKPFFGFFDTHHLQPLDIDDARTLLEKIAKLKGRTDLDDFLRTPTGRARVAAIRALAGGNPRLYLTFSDLLVSATALDDLVRPFEELVDRQLTAYYQERLRSLSPQQREIVQFLCRARIPVPVKQIAEGLFTTHNSITGQLKQLREMRYVESTPRGREVYYELAEPLMRLALQVKETHDRKPLALIVDFLRVWYEPQEIATYLAGVDPNSSGYSYFATVLQLMQTGPNLRHELLRNYLEGVPEGQCDDTTLASARCLAEESNRPEDWLRLGDILTYRKEWDEVIVALTQVIESEVAKPRDVLFARGYRGAAQVEIGRFDEAINDFSHIIESQQAPGNVIRAALFGRAFGYATKNLWELVLRDMKENLRTNDTAEVISPLLHFKTAMIIKGVFSHSTDAQKWREQAIVFVGHFARFEGLTVLGEALVKHLPEVGKSPLNHAAWDAWVEAWEAAQATLEPTDREKLDIPLRLLRTGIAYLKTKDEGSLLALPREERQLLREALGLSSER